MSQQRSIHLTKVVIGKRAESGQAIVLMALVMVALLGMLGLAIDGGGLYFLWRDAQNATDAAVLAASYARCTNGDIIKAGLAAAAKNGVLVVRSSRVPTGFTNRNVEVNDDQLGFAASLDLNPQKARILLQLLIANGVTDSVKVQEAFANR